MTDPLRRLDERIVPRLAAFFDRLIPRPPEPTGPLPFILRLRRVDDRWSQRGALALLREVPQVGALAIAAIVLVGGITVASRSDRTRLAGDGRGNGQASPGDPDDPTGDGRTEIVPPLGDNVKDYMDDARQRLLEAAAGQPDAAALGVVSFAEYRTPAQVQAMLGPAQVVRVFYRVPFALHLAPAQETEVTDFAKDYERALAQYATELEEEIKALQSNIDTNETDPDQVKSDTEQRDAHRRAVRLLRTRGGCACIYGVLVQTRLRILADAIHRPGVRLVDASAPNRRIGDYARYRPLLPEEKVTVTAGNQEPAG